MAVQNGSVALITAAQGFSFVTQQTHGSTIKYKPGWVATTVGAKLRIVVNTVRLAMHGDAADAAVLGHSAAAGTARKTRRLGCATP